MSELLTFIDAGYHSIWREGRLEETLGALGDDFEWMERFEGLDVEWELEQAGPDSALAYIHMHGRGRGSGVPTEMRYAQHWTFDGMRPVRMVLYFDLDEARRAAGLA